jgi:hypothetical protein
MESMQTKQEAVSRRRIVTGAVTGVGALCAAATSSTAEAQLVYRRGDWRAEEFQAILRKAARVRQVFEVVNINDGRFLNNIKNSMNALTFGFGEDPQQIQIVAALHGPANMVNYDDSMWAKYRIGEWLAVNDPETGRPAVRNIFYLSKVTSGTGSKEDPSDQKSSFQDTSVQGLQRRGVKFLSCHTANEEQARAIVSRLKLTDEPETIVKDLQAHALPGVLIVPGMVAAIALLQIDGHYSYVTV